jgi:pyrimidine-nucleoside phosphorylase
MSKKLAAGLKALVLDVKNGTGAFMSRYADAQLLARLMVETGDLAGTRTVAVLTSMDQPLGRFAGNWVEVQECLELFQHFSPDHPFTLPPEKLRLSSDLLILTHALAGHMLHLGGKAETPEAGAALSAHLLADGAAYRRFLQMVALQTDASEAALAAFANPAAFHRPTATRQITASHSGYLTITDCTRIGWAVQRLGAGRTHPGAPVSAHAGLEMHAKLGDKIESGQPLVTLFTEDTALLDEPEQMLRETLHIAATPRTPIPLIREIVAQEARVHRP